MARPLLKPTVDGAAISCTTVRVSPRRTIATRNLAAARGALQIGVVGTVATATLAAKSPPRAHVRFLRDAGLYS